MIEDMIQSLMTRAVTQRVSDIYILPVTVGYQIRLRQTNRVVVWQNVTAAIGQQMLTYFKFHANMAVSERRRPQVGALTWPGEPTVELRFSTVGDYANQESLVIRVIYPYAATSGHYLQAEQPKQLLALAQRRGLLLFSGPTGAGKTTTMYTVASQLAAATVVLTVEDPVEIKEPRFMQLQVNAPAGMTYEALIKVGLRHRPDVFIIGEIRDAVTAQAAVRAALSGHLVLSTVHAQTAGGTVSRLLDLGIPVSQLQQVLTAACYQRLIPRVKTTPAVLLDILAGQALWPAPKETTERWRDSLEDAVNTGTITPATAQRFVAG